MPPKAGKTDSGALCYNVCRYKICAMLRRNTRCRRENCRDIRTHPRANFPGGTRRVFGSLSWEQEKGADGWECGSVRDVSGVVSCQTLRCSSPTLPTPRGPPPPPQTPPVSETPLLDPHWTFLRSTLSSFLGLLYRTGALPSRLSALRKCAPRWASRLPRRRAQAFANNSASMPQPSLASAARSLDKTFLFKNYGSLL